MAWHGVGREMTPSPPAEGGPGRLRALRSIRGRPGPWRRTLGSLAGGFLSLILLGAIAVATREPFVFPSLGPTAFLIFAAPELPPAAPRNALCGHLIGVLCGYGALVVTGLLDAPTDVATGISPERAMAAALSLGLTSALMVLLRVPHPPACATTLIVSLGVLRRPDQLVVVMLAIALLLAEGVVMTRLAGVDYPLWSRRPVPQPATETAGSRSAP
jgi:CBS domain-containing membrane protein